MSLEKKIPLPEYPRPQFVRKDNWINLNGEWNFAFDNKNIGLKEKWYKKNQSNKFDKKIIVPFCFQCKLSGINDKSFHDIVWYKREFSIPKKFVESRILLHFEAVDYSCRVYLNGEFVGSHEGGYIGFTFDITDNIKEENYLVIRVIDPSTDLEIPRGKQYWKENLEAIFYPRVTGIWQTVWLEFISPKYHLKKIKFFPDITKSEVLIEFEAYGIGFSDLSLCVNVMFNNEDVTKEEINLNFLGKLGEKKDRKLVKEKIELFHREFKTNPNCFMLKIRIPENLLHLWDVDNPNLYDLYLKIYNKKTKEVFDEVRSYFGMRNISISDDVGNIRNNQGINKQIFLNNKPIYQKLFLVQGYWSDSLYTAPYEDAIKLDIQYIKDFGFNGLRTHQKAFSRRFLYWCDKMGALVWGEIGNAYRYSVNSQLKLINEFVAEIERDFNHPSIIMWVPLNEGWGVSGAEKDPKKADFTVSLYYLIKSIDPTRLIVDDDGWWHTRTDILTRHFYFPDNIFPYTLEDEIENHDKAVPKVYLKPYKYNNEPIVYSEIGGYGYDFYGNLDKKWGYGKLLESEEDLFRNVLNLLKEFDKRKKWIHGFCYTELYDLFQEINGLLTMDRTPKFPPEKLKKELDNLFY